MFRKYLDVPLEVRINGDRISGLVHPNSSPIYKQDMIHLLTIDPNFLGHPSIVVDDAYPP